MHITHLDRFFHFLYDAEAQTLDTMIFWFVDIRDVALAHIQAFEVESANGRYCMVGDVVYFYEAANILRRLYPTLSIPKR